MCKFVSINVKTGVTINDKVVFLWICNDLSLLKDGCKTNLALVCFQTIHSQLLNINKRTWPLF